MCGAFFMHKKLSVSIGQYSSAGVKKINQDFHGVLMPEEPQLTTKGIAIALADGISSSDVSQEASQAAVTGFLGDYYSTSDAWSVKQSATRVITAMNAWLYAKTQSGAGRFNKDKGYICTFSAMVLKSNTAHLFHSGDTRIYRLDGKSLEQLTQDHRTIISAEESYLSRALGIGNFIDLDYKQVTLNEGDFFVLATDGVYEFLTEQQMSSAMTNDEFDLDSAAQTLVESALQAGSDDNLTVQLVRIDALPRQNIDELHQQAIELPPAPKLSARMLFDGYRIVREIYISSRSHVFLAEDLDTGQQVVLKLPSTELQKDEEYLENMLMEDWIAQRIDNAHVLKAIPPVRKRAYLYTVTEYIEGKNLAQWMIDHPSPDLESVRNIVEQIAKGLQAFHRQEMVHQDLRPNNIMIDANGTVKIIDFGATKVAGITEIKSKNEGIVGTAQFTAPEYFVGKLGTSQSDIFSLGVMAYQMLSGKLPYGNAVSNTKTERDQNNLIYRSLVIDQHSIPGWADYAIQKATNVNPLKRYEAVSEFVYDLRHPNSEYLGRKKPPLIERNPVLFWQCTAVVLLLVVIVQAFLYHH